ncbi:MAG TPA: 5'-nucleotidase C-terminal domain-containing protein [Planococcus sp. (in: firmicutes)]|nr:5'-nucleotidase C-terminal domain-containing protein [Planococcus sp. (in: firmicutes)]
MVNVLKNKKFVASAVVIAAVATAVSPASAEEMKFTDVPDRYKDAVQFLFDLEIIKGETETSYGTNHSVKRQDAAVMIAKALGYDPAGEYDESGFTDVPKSAKWAVNALKQDGFIDGKTKTRFGANDILTRNETAKILAEAGNFDIDDSVKETKFTDVNERFAKYVDALVDNEIAFGKTATQFGANQAVTRGEAALFLERTAIKMMDGVYSLSLMHLNDTHASLDNAAKQVTAVKEHRAENPDALLLHAGDVFSGTLYFNEFQGEADVALMNLMDFDAMTFGNHEFDLGTSEEGHKALQEFVAAAEFPFVSANVDFSGDPLFNGLFQTKISHTPEDSNIYTGIVKEVNGEKVGIFGLTTEETEDISSPELISFSEDYLDDAQIMVDEFEAMGVDKVIALTHIGFDDNPAVDNDLMLAEGVEGIDIIVGGHTHTELEEPFVVDEDGTPTVIVQAGQYGANLGTLDVLFDGEGVVFASAGELIDINTHAEDAEAVKVLAPFKEKVKEISEQETTATALEALTSPRSGDDLNAPSVRKNETALGNIITDGMLAKAKEFDENVVMAFQNGGGIRAGIDQGPITVGEIITVLPFGNTLATMDITGADLKAAFEVSVGQYPRENGGFLHVAGAKVQFDSSKALGDRVVSIETENADGSFTEIQDATTYTVATNVFTAKGGDGYAMFEKAYAEGRVTDLGISDWENLQAELERIGQVSAEIEGRIVDANAAN